VETMYFRDGKLFLLDQTRLPGEVTYEVCATYQDVARCIRDMKVRGAPAIGAAAAYGMALAVLVNKSADKDEHMAVLERAGEELLATRPTAVNLRWAVERMLEKAKASAGSAGSPQELAGALLSEAETIFREDVTCNERIGIYGLELVPDEARILTHCNAGALATAGYGTALGVIRAAKQAGKKITVFADETRPFLQGARLTTFELMRDGIDVVLITDSMAGYLMSREGVDLVIVGADRIAANGDTANKIGTYGLAVLAHAHGIPFYVAAPLSTVDFRLESGEDIPIEERAEEEITHFRGQRVAPEGVRVWNPAFDVTPHRLITAIITDTGVVRPPFKEGLAQLG